MDDRELIFCWVANIIQSCKTGDHLFSCSRLIGNYLNLLGDEAGAYALDKELFYKAQDLKEREEWRLKL